MDERADTVWVVPDDVRPLGSLDGVLVADFSRVLAGPLATMILGDLGAEVVKVEHPDGGDDTRAWGPPWLKDSRGHETSDAAYYLCANRNKRSLAIDIASAAGQARSVSICCLTSAVHSTYASIQNSGTVL